MGNKSSSPSVDIYNNTKKLALEKFQKEIHRKMTIHILSTETKKCIEFIEFFTNEKVKENSKELLEKDIHKKINLYSFMNYKIYDDVSKLINEIKDIADNASNNPKNSNYSEVVVLLDNSIIEKQIDKIRDFFENDFVLNECYFPFLIIISPKKIDLKSFSKSKTFHYKITFEDIVNYNKKKNEEKNGKDEGGNENLEKKKEASALFRKLYVLFCYYNELGDEFSFINSENKENLIQIEEDMDGIAFINILFLGQSGVGKSTLINLILEEKKSLEGGTGFSTTSKKILIYKKSGVPIRLYDAKGIENQETVDNYDKILECFNPNVPFCNDTIHAIFYLLEHKKNGTNVYQMEFKLFEKLYKYKFPVIFIITKTPYDINKEPSSEKGKNERKTYENTIINAIKGQIMDSFKDKDDAKRYIDKYTKFHFVNLIHDYSSDIPVFGVNKILSFFNELVTEEKWNELKKFCNEKNEAECKKACENNPFLKIYSEFNNEKVRNKSKAKTFLLGLDSGAFFSGMVPGLDIGMEYYYKYIFKRKLETLYGFDYDIAKKTVIKQKENKKDIILQNDLTKTNNSKNTDNENNVLIEKRKESERKDEELENSNIGKNITSAVRGAFEIGGIVLKALPTAGEVALESGVVISRVGVSIGVKAVSWFFLPVTCGIFGVWSSIKVEKDCFKILNIFDEAFDTLKFKTLLNYINSFEDSISNLKSTGEKIIKEENKD